MKSDHNNLKYFATARLYKPRHARWAEELSQYDFVISHVSGVNTSVADALSRAPNLSFACSLQNFLLDNAIREFLVGVLRILKASPVNCVKRIIFLLESPSHQ